MRSIPSWRKWNLIRNEMKRYAFYYNSDACSGCKTCQIACKDKNNLPVGMNWRRVYEITGGGWKRSGAAWISDVIAYNISISCNHCEKPVCLDACPAKAIEKGDNGIVKIDQEKCIKCGTCLEVCPSRFGAVLKISGEQVPPPIPEENRIITRKSKEE